MRDLDIEFLIEYQNILNKYFFNNLQRKSKNNIIVMKSISEISSK